MGLLDDLQMGFGLKERDDDYYERTAATIGREQGAGAEERYRGSNVFQEKPAFGGPFSFFGRGGEGGGITGPRDFVDGGGLGRSGDTFVGGPVSILANLLGIRPMGYNDRDRVGQRVGMGAFNSGVLRPTQSVTGAIPSEDVVDDIVATSITPKDYSVYGGIDFPMYITGAPAAPTSPKDYSVYGGIDFPMPTPPAPTLEAGIMSEPMRTTAGTYTAAYEPDSDLSRINEKMLDLYPNFFEFPESRRKTLIKAAKRLGY